MGRLIYITTGNLIPKEIVSFGTNTERGGRGAETLLIKNVSPGENYKFSGRRDVRKFVDVNLGAVVGDSEEGGAASFSALQCCGVKSPIT